MNTNQNLPLFFPVDMHHGDQQIIQNAPLLLNWLKLVHTRGIRIESILIQSVDFIGENETRRPLFIKLKAEAYDSHNRRIPGICLLRGHAVAVLPILECEGEEWVLLVSQARLGVGLLDCLEIPAGMCDGDADIHAVAIRELAEETGLECQKEDLQELYPGLDWMDASPGLLDEGVRLFKVHQQMSPSQLNTLKSQTFGKAEENEYIRIHLCKAREVLPQIKDSKTLLALSLYLLGEGK